MKIFRKLLFFLIVFFSSTLCLAQKDSLKIEFESGKKNFEKKIYDKALINFNNIIHYDSTNAMANYYRGLIYLQKEETYEKAYNDFNKAIILGFNNAEIFYNRGFLTEFIETSNMSYRPEIITKALNDINKAIELDSSYIFAYYTRAKIWKDMHEKIGYNNDSACIKEINDYSIIIRLSPNDAKAYYNRAITELELKNYDKDKVCSDFEKSLSLGLNKEWIIDIYNKNCK